MFEAGDRLVVLTQLHERDANVLHDLNPDKFTTVLKSDLNPHNPMSKEYKTLNSIARVERPYALFAHADNDNRYHLAKIPVITYVTRISLHIFCQYLMFLCVLGT